MNASLLQDKSFRTALGEDLKSFFELNTDSIDELTIVWEASNVYSRGKIIAYALKKKRDSFNKIKELESEIKINGNK